MPTFRRPVEPKEPNFDSGTFETTMQGCSMRHLFSGCRYDGHPTSSDHAAPRHAGRRVAILIALLAFAVGGSPGAALASSLLSGYGGPGEGSEAIIGSTLVNGPSGGAGGGSAGAGGSPVSGTAGSGRGPSAALGGELAGRSASGSAGPRGSAGVHNAPAAPATARLPRERGRRGRPSRRRPPTAATSNPRISA